jgi:tetratricopeptide (TPR) repeat protein
VAEALAVIKITSHKKSPYEIAAQSTPEAVDFQFLKQICYHLVNVDLHYYDTKDFRMHDMRNDFRVALCSGDYEQAERLATNQLALLGESSLWLNEMGILLVSQGRLAEALLHFDRSAAADSSNLEAILNGAIVLADLGFYEEASIRFDTARTIESQSEGDRPPNAKPLVQGKTTSLTLAEKALETAKIYRQLKDLASSEEGVRKSLSISETPEAYVELARIFIEQNSPEKAQEALNNAQRLSPSASEAFVLAAQCYLSRNLRKEALDALAKAELLGDNSRTASVLRRALHSSAHA